MNPWNNPHSGIKWLKLALPPHPASSFNKNLEFFHYNNLIHVFALFRPIRIVSFITWLIVIQKMDYILIKITLIIIYLNLPLILKTSWHFGKWISLNTVFMTQHIHNVLRFFTALQPFFYIYSLKRRTKWRRVSVFNLNDFYWNSKVLLCSWLKVNFSFF